LAIFLLRRIHPRIPAALIVLLVVTIVSWMSGDWRCDVRRLPSQNHQLMPTSNPRKLIIGLQ
jgi:MFS superfamily sulfate permease-like transporter